MRVLNITLLLVFVALLVPVATAFSAARFNRVTTTIGARRDGTCLSALPAAKPLPTMRNSRTNAAIAGRLFPFLRKFFIGPAKFKEITAGVGNAVDLGDLCLIGVFGWAFPALSKIIYNRSHGADDPSPNFDVSRLGKISSLISQIARIAGLVYIADVLAIALNVIGIKFPSNFTAKCAQVLYTLWAAARLLPYKRNLIKKKFKSTDDSAEKVKICDTLANIVIAAFSAFILLDELTVPVGRALQSVFALGGVGTLVFSLASKDVAGQIVNGIALASSNKYDEGDKILLGDGTQGTVCNMGWISTDLRGTDEIIIKIPNSMISNQRTCNLSRLKRSQVKTTLWFSHDDIDKLPALIEDIKKEIGSSCPNLITDGSRPFRVAWRDYKDDHLEVMVDCHIEHPPATSIYWETRQKVLIAIARAADHNDVQFAIPNVRVLPSGDMKASSAQQRYGIEEEHSVDGSPSST